MKKLIALLLVLATVMAFAACGKKEEAAKVESVEALTALKAVVTAYNTKYEGTDYQLPLVGGGYETMNWEGPDAVPTNDEAYLTSVLLVPETELVQVAAAASAMHAMNTNTFCAGAYNLIEGADYAAFAASLRDAIQGNRWMCGFPEKLIMMNVGNCLIVVYGNGELVENFKTVLVETYASAVAVYDEAIQG